MESKLLNWLAAQGECFQTFLGLPPQPPTLHWDAWNDCAVLVCHASAAPAFQTLVNNGHVSNLTIAVRYDGEPMRVAKALNQRAKA
ncbi:hypothetical protein ACQ4N7_28495 [Nodosilinea sp. AN01ver1]|uniref:hypothetical protein n=1 Tax=Nodosilinea sp. AN01ver1 TaxID=3423362 RepID=UPI003D321C05